MAGMSRRASVGSPMALGAPSIGQLIALSSFDLCLPIDLAPVSGICVTGLSDNEVGSRLLAGSRPDF